MGIDNDRIDENGVVHAVQCVSEPDGRLVSRTLCMMSQVPSNSVWHG